jgi:hypothetical protein
MFARIQFAASAFGTRLTMGSSSIALNRSTWRFSAASLSTGGAAFRTTVSARKANAPRAEQIHRPFFVAASMRERTDDHSLTLAATFELPIVAINRTLKTLPSLQTNIARHSLRYS